MTLKQAPLILDAVETTAYSIIFTHAKVAYTRARVEHGFGMQKAKEYVQDQVKYLFGGRQAYEWKHTQSNRRLAGEVHCSTVNGHNKTPFAIILPTRRLVP